MDRVNLVYSTEISENIELPFRILVIGNFSFQTTSALLDSEKPVPVTATNFNDVFASRNARLKARIPNRLIEESDIWLDINIPFRKIDDFLPDSIVQAVPEMESLVQLKRVLSLFKSEDDDLVEAYKALEGIPVELLTKLGLQKDQLDKDTINMALVLISQKLGNQLDEILHNEGFQSLEASWRSLLFLVRQLVTGENCEIDILDVSKSVLLEDIDNCGETEDSFLYKIIYLDEFGIYGGNPFSVIIADYEFESLHQDLRLLEHCGTVASCAYVPFVSAASPALLGMNDFSEISGSENSDQLFHAELQFIKWRSFRDSNAARFIGLTLPSLLLRNPYDYQKETIRSFNYREGEGKLWGNAAYAFSSCMIQSFIKYRWYMNIVGEDGGTVKEFSWTKDNTVSKDQPLVSLPVIISERSEAQLIRNGFIPLVYDVNKNAVVFHSANSLQAYNGNTASEKNLSLDERLAVQLPYLFIICRLAHYLKVIQRDNIGTSKTSQQLEDELNDWLVQYVSDMENPIPEVRARRPLRKARIKLVENETRISEYEMQLSVTPHLRYMGSSFSLSLEGKL